MKKYSFSIIAYKNGKLTDVIDSAYDYPTRERAIKAARSNAEYGQILSGGELEITPSGAIRWFTDSEGNRCRREYKVVNNQ